MGLQFEAPAKLDDAAIRHIVREAESGMAPGANAKALLVQATQAHLASLFAAQIEAKVREVLDTAEMLGVEPEMLPLLPEGMTPEQADGALADAPLLKDDPAKGSFLLARAAILSKPVLPMNQGKWLAKFGIVAEHVKAVEGATPCADPAAAPPPGVNDGRPIATGPTGVFADAIEQPEVTDAELREMLGLPPLPGSAPSPLSGAAAAPSAAAPPTIPSATDASSAGPASPPPPAPSNARDAFLLFSEGTAVDDDALRKRLDISRSTLHNYMTGKTGRVKCSGAMARVMVSEIDARVAKLRQAAEIFAMIRD